MKNKKYYFDAHDNNVFSTFNTDHVGMKNLMTDLALNREIFDADGNKVSKRDAEDTLHKMCMAFFELEPGFTPREYNRAEALHGRSFFQIIEEVEDKYIDYGMRENELFNKAVNMRSRALGQDNLFINEAEDIILAVNRVGTSHHDFSLQRLNVGSTYSVPVNRYGAAVGMELNRYLARQEDWTKLIEVLGRSVIMAQQEEIASLIVGAAAKMPVPSNDFIISGPATSATENTFDRMLAAVSMANYGASLTIFGTKLGLQQLNGLANVSWASEDQKKAIANTGYLGSYKGTPMIEIPNRFKTKALDMTDVLYNDKKIVVFANGVDNTLIDGFTYGETEIVEADSKAAAIDMGRRDDVGKYEIQLSWGYGLKVRRQFGEYTITP